MTDRFFIAGLPVPKGSLKAFVPKGWTRPVLTSTGGAPLKAWASCVTYSAMEHGVKPIYGAVFLRLEFVLTRPKSLPKRIVSHVKKPDLDKLVRSVLDALTGVAYGDDSQVDGIACEKRYSTDGATGLWLAIHDGEAMRDARPA